ALPARRARRIDHNAMALRTQPRRGALDRGRLGREAGRGVETDAVGALCHVRGLARRAAKKSARSLPHSSASTPRSTVVWWVRRGSANRSITEPQAPVLGSRAPNTRRAIRAWRIAPAHIAQGSIVT